MKKYLAVLLAALLCCVFSLACADYKEYTSGDYRYVLLDDGTAEIIGYSGEASSLIPPDTLDGIPYTYPDAGK